MTTLFSKQDLSAKELLKEIEKMYEEEELIDGDPEVHDEWKRRINFLINLHNIKSKFVKIENVK